MLSKPLAQLAFCVGQPGQVLSPTDFENWSDALLTGMTVGEKASLRRLILEAQTMLVASLKDMAEPSEGAAPKKVGVAERNARMDQQIFPWREANSRLPSLRALKIGTLKARCRS